MVDVSVQPVSPASARQASPASDVKVATSGGQPNAAATQDAQQVESQRAASDVAARKAEDKAADATAKAREPALKPQLRLSIAFNEEAQRFVYKGLDQKGKTVSQYPTEDALQRIAVLRQAIADTLTGSSARGALVNTTL